MQLSKKLLFFMLVFVSLILVACSSNYQAPVGQAGEPMYLNSGRQHLVNAGETLYAVAWMYDLDFAALAQANNLNEPFSLTPGQMLTVDLRGKIPANRSNDVASAPSASNTVAVAAPATVVAAPLKRAALPASVSERPSRTPLPSAQSAEQPAIAVTQPAQTTISVPSPATAPTPTPPSPAVSAATPPVAIPPAPSSASKTATTKSVPSWAWPHSGTLLTRFAESSGDNKGIDIAGSSGDPVLAAADGEVVYAGSGLLRYGNLVIIKHNERFLSAYAHNRALLVAEKAKVKKGQRIAELGSSGVDRNMLHFEIRLNGKPVDPLQYLPAK
jgi:lipoprotein NlpD